MKADDDRNSSRLQCVIQHTTECPFQLFQFSIDRNPQGLKNPRGGLLLGCGRNPSRQCPVNHRHEVGSSTDGSSHSLTDNLFCDPIRESLLAKILQYSRQFLFSPLREEVTRGNACGRVEPHVQQSGRIETEAPHRICQLVGR